MTGRPVPAMLAAVALALATGACGTAPGPESGEAEATASPATSPDPAPPTADPPAAGPSPTPPDGDTAGAGTPGPTGTASEARIPTADATPAPAWLGTRVLTPGPDGTIPAQPTPPELRDRRIVTVDLLEPPPTDEYAASVGAVPDHVLARSTWSPECPVDRDELRYVTVVFRGFDGLAHTGELLVHADVAADLVAVFAALYADDVPIEEMRVVTPGDLDAEPTGDGNNTTAFVCRPSRGSTSWSQHAYGRAVDVNPFHNPYVKGDVVLPELATAYTDRSDVRAGMILPGDPVVAAFAAVGWGWGGDWTSVEDPMHFSANGR